ncbi:hypothetical protein [Bradyrhizobium paxllaeri]|uniref:hypothetical protein n=1 Tax=Bradyrhizobium paxllaeri TaxID=190148 RepID=UPI000810B55F|nr:hypothetical protein [Bradyrhizobium paxllaeri]
MPLARYFIYVGGALLALLLIASACLPMLPLAIEASSSPVTIRIHSEQKLPERVVYDTTVPTIVPQKIANAEQNVSDPATTVADVPKAREAFAQLRPSDAVQPRASDSRRREVKQQHHRKPAKKRRAPHEFMMARPAHYGWFGYGTW